MQPSRPVIGYKHPRHAIQGRTQACIDRWLQGYEHAQSIRERRAKISTRTYLQA